MAVDAAIHAPHDYADECNHHAHVMTPTRVVDADGLRAKTRQLDVRSTASVEVEAIRESWGSRVNDALEQALVPERVDHRSYARQGVEMEPTVKMGHASAAIERRAQREQEAAGEERHTVIPRGQMNEAIQEKRRLGAYIERGREWLHEVDQWARDHVELAVQRMSDLVRGTAQAMRAGVQARVGDGFGDLPALDRSPRREQAPRLDMDQPPIERDRQRERQRDIGHDIGFGR